MEKIKESPELIPGVSVRICQSSDIDTLKAAIPDEEGFHETRYKLQEAGKSSYLIAWQDQQPVGHLYLRWDGSSQPVVKEFIEDTPELSAISVWPPENRSQGIGSKLIAEAEEMAIEKGYHQVGLSVRLDNNRARELYEKLGYQDWGHGTYNDVWQESIAENTEKICNYMIKQL